MGAILCDLELGMTLAVQSNKEICGKLIRFCQFFKVYNKEDY